MAHIRTEASAAAADDNAKSGPPPPSGPVEGSAHVRYNHYNQPFSILDGTLMWETIDDEYAISFVFEGNYGKILKDENGEQEYLAFPCARCFHHYLCLFRQLLKFQGKALRRLR